MEPPEGYKLQDIDNYTLQKGDMAYSKIGGWYRINNYAGRLAKDIVNLRAVAVPISTPEEKLIQVEDLNYIIKYGDYCSHYNGGRFEKLDAESPAIGLTLKEAKGRWGSDFYIKTINIKPRFESDKPFPYGY